MPDAAGRFKGISVPAAWCARCKLVDCVCAPAPAPAPAHADCGTPRCCGSCDGAVR